ncbi:MAG: hypothetical protein NTV63_05065 [Candidatus Woesearchaeota archaeon]|nr:hypothetical protein [Candidatus Woesearchaeota archaeon]
MKIALVNPPPYGVKMPPIGIPYLSAKLKNEGHQVKSFDLNIILYNENQIERKMWLFENSILWQKDSEKIFLKKE